ncbi:MAG: ABC transporter permease [Bacteroidetes bacterium]|nr:ABC transporter permease [Bacteroidota bacterium]
MTPYTLHITLYDLIIFGMIFTGWVFCLFLWFVKSINRSANRFLALALLAMTLWMLRILHVNLPAQMLLAVGPLLYFYVLKITQREHQFKRKDLLHISPLIFAIVPAPILQILVFVSVISYLYLANRLIQKFYKGLQPVLMDRSLLEFRWLRHLLGATAMLWVLWLASELGVPVYSSVYIFFAVMITWMAAAAFLRPQAGITKAIPVIQKTVPSELKQKSIWLKKAMEANRYYLDPELSLTSMAEKLSLTTHELSRIINTGLKKSFNDFINEYRVRDLSTKMLDPAYSHLTLLGIAYESGFNSQTTFTRVLKQLTGKSPLEYKNELKKDYPFYNLDSRERFPAIISNHNTTHKWSDGKLNRNYMFRNYLKIAWRNMLRSKVYSALNISGLAAGMAVALLIGLWIYEQYSYDRFLPGYNQLYQVKLNFIHSGEVHTQSGSSIPLIEEFKKNYPEVKYASETDWGGSHSLVTGDKKLDPFGMTVGSDFLKMFPYPFIKGNPNSVFSDPNSIVLTESIAKALFGNQDPINKVLRIDNQYNIKVTGVIKDVPINSTLQFAYLLPFSFKEENNPHEKNERLNWQNYSTPEYVELQPGANAEAFENKIKHSFDAHDKVNKVEVYLHAAKNWRLLSQFKDGKPVDGFIQYVRMFGIIGVLVLVIACINFVNLSTARAEKRAREVGVRKSIGSSRRDLIFQFFTESMLITLVAFALSILIVQLVLPSFNTLIYGDIGIPYGNPTFWCIMAGYVLITGLLAGSRPAFYLSSFKPVKVLKGTVQLGKNASLPRKIMVVAQFTCSIALIISTLIIYQQLQYARDRPKGYDVDRLVFTDNSNDLQKNFELLKHDLLQSGQVVSVTKSGSNMMYVPASFNVLDFPGKKQGESMEMGTTSISPGYFKTVGMTFAAGHDFFDGTLADTLNIVINQAAAQKMRLKEPLNQLIKIDYSKNALRIIGMVNNAIIGSPFYSAMPTLYVYNPGWAGAILYRLNPNVKTQEAMAKIAVIFNKYNPSFPFNYRFADEAYNSSFQLESLVGLLAGIFAGLTIFISCLGLFGLAAYTAEQRKKEIGIRKVLGASITNVWVLLSKDFIVLVLLSCVIAAPVALYYLHNWLQKYDYHISIGPGVFVASALMAIVITLVTVSFQAIKAALTNPVKSLRSE